MAAYAVEGVGPIAVTEGGVQRLIPLSALEADDSGVITIKDRAYGTKIADDWIKYLSGRGRLTASAAS